MNNKDIKPDEWGRIFLGDVPPEFILEVIIRMAFIYIVLVVALRLMGRRMEAMLSRGEMVSLVTLGASVGVAIHTPERGLLPSAMVIIIILCMQLLQGYITSRSSKAERLILDEISTLVEDGRLLPKEMKKSRITRDRLFGALRFKSLKNLGMVQRVYFEAKGTFSIVTYSDGEPRPGLCLLPEIDSDFRKEMEFNDEMIACRSCGTITSNDRNGQKCSNCGKKDWEPAVTGSE